MTQHTDEDQSFFTWLNQATSLPVANALVPLNPHKFPSYALGSALTSDQRFERNDFSQPWLNLQSSYEYLDSAHNDTHYNTRFKKLFFDTCVVNGLCEVPTNVGAALAGSYANDMAAQYTDEIVQDELDKSLETEFSCLLRLRGPKYNGTDTGYDVPLFNGVGAFKERLPASQRTNPLTGPTLPPRRDRPIWSYKFFGSRGGAFIMPNSDLVIRFPVGSLIKRVIFKGKGSKILEKGLNLALLFFYICYSLFMKRFLTRYGMKYISVFQNKLIRIVVRSFKSILNKINRIKFKISNRVKKFKSKRKRKRKI